jgi:hypothetical protein
MGAKVFVLSDRTFSYMSSIRKEMLSPHLSRRVSFVYFLQMSKRHQGKKEEILLQYNFLPSQEIQFDSLENVRSLSTKTFAPISDKNELNNNYLLFV